MEVDEDFEAAMAFGNYQRSNPDFKAKVEELTLKADALGLSELIDSVPELAQFQEALARQNFFIPRPPIEIVPVSLPFETDDDNEELFRALNEWGQKEAQKLGLTQDDLAKLKAAFTSDDDDDPAQ